MRRLISFIAVIFSFGTASAQVVNMDDPNLVRTADGVASQVNRYDEKTTAPRIPQKIDDAVGAGYKFEYLECTKLGEATILKVDSGPKRSNQELCVMPLKCTIQVSALTKSGKQVSYRLRAERTAACRYSDNRCPSELECMKEKVGEAKLESDYSSGTTGSGSTLSRDRVK